MQRLFAVMRGRGPAWNSAEPLDRQHEWRPHADFMNALVTEGFVVFGGPLGDNGDTLLIVRAQDESEIRKRLCADPWPEGMLPLLRIAPWDIRLGEERLAELN
jgi:uncharacterized protein YciI